MVLVGCACLSCTFSFDSYVYAAVCLNEAWDYQLCLEAGVQLLTLASTIPHILNSTCPCFSLKFSSQKWPSDVVMDKEECRCAAKNWNISKPATNAIKPSLTKENYLCFTITPSWCHILTENYFQGWSLESKISSALSDEHLENSENCSHLRLLRCSTAALLYVKAVKVFLCAGASSPCSSYQGKMLHFFCSHWDGYWLGLGQVNNNKNEFAVLVLFLSGEQGCSEQRRTSGSNLWVASSSLVTHQAGLVLPRKAQCQPCSGQEGCPPCTPKQLQGGQAVRGNPHGQSSLPCEAAMLLQLLLTLKYTRLFLCSVLGWNAVWRSAKLLARGPVQCCSAPCTPFLFSFPIKHWMLLTGLLYFTSHTALPNYGQQLLEPGSRMLHVEREQREGNRTGSRSLRETY